MGGKAMWIEGEQLQRLDSALELGRTTDIDRLLDEIFASGGREGATPTACAVCPGEPRPGAPPRPPPRGGGVLAAGGAGGAPPAGVARPPARPAPRGDRAAPADGT